MTIRSKTGGEPTTVEFITPPNPLAAKLNAPGGRSLDDMVAQAQAVIRQQAATYPMMAKEEIDGLRKTVGQLRGAKPKDAAKTAKAILRIAHSIKGQAGTFDYPLLTMVADQLCKFIERLSWADLGLLAEASYREVVVLHADTLDLILKQQMTGNGGPMGQGLISGLKKAADKRLDQLPPIDPDQVDGHTLPDLLQED